MKICPKCRQFTDDELLRFCMKDGTPLVFVNPNDKLWSKGDESIHETRRIEKREVRKQQFKKMVSMIITTVMIISIVTVITTNSWIFLADDEPAEKTEIVKNNQETPKPSPLPEATQTSEVPAESPIPSPTTPNDNRPTPSPKPSGTQLPVPIPKPTVSTKPTEDPSKPKTPEIKAPPTAVVTTPVCNTATESAEIRRGYSSQFLNQIKATQPGLSRQYMNKERQAVFVGVILNDFSLNVSPDCRSATALHKYQAILINRNGTRTTIDFTKSFSCNKNTSWGCR